MDPTIAQSLQTFSSRFTSKMNPDKENIEHQLVNQIVSKSKKFNNDQTQRKIAFSVIVFYITRPVK